MKKCPFCAEEIQDEAVKCKYCNSDLIHTSKPSSSPLSINNPRIGKDKIMGGLVFIGIGVLILMGSGINDRSFQIVAFVLISVGLIAAGYGKFENWYHWK